MREVPGYLTALTTLLWSVGVRAASAEPPAVTVFLDRGGQIISVDGADVAIPRFGGGDRAWAGLVACVQQKFAPFQVDVVDRRPAHAGFITALVGGSPGLVGHDDDTVAGVSPYDGTVLRGALVHVFTQRGTDDVDGLCAVAAHEVGHALGLDHSTTCGDLMSYHHDACGPQRFLDVAAPCGTQGARTCGNGDATQNAYRRLGELVGFRAGPAEPPPVSAEVPPVSPEGPATTTDPWASEPWASEDDWADDEDAAWADDEDAAWADDEDAAEHGPDRADVNDDTGPARSTTPPLAPGDGEEADALAPRPEPRREHRCGGRVRARRW